MKNFISLLVFSLLIGAPAWAVDPQCVGQDSRNQQTTADYSDGVVDVCIDERREGGSPYPATEAISCFVSLVSEDGTTQVNLPFQGAPGSYHALAVPSNITGLGLAQGGPCTDAAGNVGGRGITVTATFPAAPAQPGPRPPSLLP